MNEKNEYEKKKERLLNNKRVATFLIVFGVITGAIISANNVFKFVDHINAYFERPISEEKKNNNTPTPESLVDISSDTVLESLPSIIEETISVIYQGTVVDADTRRPVEGVTVSFGQRQTKTDNLGFFQFRHQSENRDEPNYLKFSKSGYRYKGEYYIIPSTSILVQLKKER